MRASIWVPALLLALAACGGKSTGTTGGGGGGGGGGGEGDGGEGGEGAASCEPGRCLADISTAIAEKRPQSRACYDAAVKKAPGLAGRIIINFRIDESGNVSETSQGMQDDQITDETLVTCVSDVIKTVSFAASKKGKTTRAYHQFEFGTNGDGGE
jgi:hypothetical protein